MHALTTVQLSRACQVDGRYACAHSPEFALPCLSTSFDIGSEWLGGVQRSHGSADAVAKVGLVLGTAIEYMDALSHVRYVREIMKCF